MSYSCDKCGNTVDIRPNSGHCAICDGRLLPRPSADNPTWEDFDQIDCFLCGHETTPAGVYWNGEPICMACHGLDHFQKAQLANMAAARPIDLQPFDHAAETLDISASQFGAAVATNWIDNALRTHGATLDKATWQMLLAEAADLGRQAKNAYVETNATQ